MKKILYILVGILLVGCIQENKDEGNNTGAPNKGNSFIGEWFSVFRGYEYSSHININSDKTFSFEYGACEMSGFSEGNWEVQDSLIVLNSSNPDSCFYLEHFGVDCISPIDTTKESEFIIETTNKNCEPKTYTAFVKFESEMFYIDGDTLKHIITKEKLCPEIRNNFLKTE